VPLEIGALVSDREGTCINVGMDDMIGYRVPTQRSVFYDWILPNGWRIQDDDSVWFIRAITDGKEGQNLPVSVYSFNDCGISSPVTYLQDVLGIESGLVLNTFPMNAPIEEVSEDEFDIYGLPVIKEVGYLPQGFTVMISPTPTVGYDNVVIQWLVNDIEFGDWRDSPYYDWYYDYEYWNSNNVPQCTMIGVIISDGRCSSKLNNIELCMPDEWPEAVYYDEEGETPMSKSQPTKLKAQSKNENTVGLFITPNPANDNVQISLNGIAKASNVFIFDSKGVLVKKIIMNTDTYSLNTSDLKQGVYFVQVISGNHRIVEKLVITD
jgi:hypothetical protein